MDAEEKRRCTKCKRDLPISYFYLLQKDGTKRLSRCKECTRVWRRSWSQTPEGKYVWLLHKGRRHKVTISKEDFTEWYKKQPRKCAYCGIAEVDLQRATDPLIKSTYQLSVDRINNSRGYEKGNLVLCCLRCNQVKGEFLTHEEMRWVGQQIIRKRWENDGIPIIN